MTLLAYVILLFALVVLGTLVYHQVTGKFRDHFQRATR